MLSLIILFIFSSFFLSTCSALYCPNAKDLYPCKCSTTNGLTTISCDTNENINLTSIFSKLSHDVRAVEETYYELSIGNSQLFEIPENAFGKIKFNSILIREQCSLLKRIHPNAFSYQSKTTHFLWIEARNVIPDKSSPNFFYDLFNSFQNLESIKYFSHIGTLEEKFSKKLNNLGYLGLRVDAIKGSPFSNMSKIYTLTFIPGDLNYISKNALKMGNSDERRKYILSIFLSNNKLNGSSFENGVFTEPSLKKVYLSLNGNKITYLDEAVFMPFLTSKNRNELYIDGNPLDCDDCRSAWICKSNKSMEIRNAITEYDDAICVDGRNFLDCNNNFLKCK